MFWLGCNGSCISGFFSPTFFFLLAVIWSTNYCIIIFNSHYPNILCIPTYLYQIRWMSNVISLIIDWLKCDFWWSSPELGHGWTFHTGGQNTITVWSKVRWKDSAVASKSREGLHGYCCTFIIYFIAPEVGKKWTSKMCYDAGLCAFHWKDVLSHVLFWLVCVFSPFFCISSWVKCTLFSLENCQEWTRFMAMGRSEPEHWWTEGGLNRRRVFAWLLLSSWMLHTT